MATGMRTAGSWRAAIRCVVIAVACAVSAAAGRGGLEGDCALLACRVIRVAAESGGQRSPAPTAQLSALCPTMATEVRGRLP